MIFSKASAFLSGGVELFRRFPGKSKKEIVSRLLINSQRTIMALIFHGEKLWRARFESFINWNCYTPHKRCQNYWPFSCDTLKF